MLLAICASLILTGCSAPEEQARNRERQARINAEYEYNENYNTCIYRVTGPFGSASFAVMQECARLAEQGKTA